MGFVSTSSRRARSVYILVPWEGQRVRDAAENDNRECRVCGPQGRPQSRARAAGGSADARLQVAGQQARRRAGLGLCDPKRFLHGSRCAVDHEQVGARWSFRFALPLLE